MKKELHRLNQEQSKTVSFPPFEQAAKIAAAEYNRLIPAVRDILLKDALDSPYNEERTFILSDLLDTYDEGDEIPVEELEIAEQHDRITYKNMHDERWNVLSNEAKEQYWDKVLRNEYDWHDTPMGDDGDFSELGVWPTHLYLTVSALVVVAGWKVVRGNPSLDLTDFIAMYGNNSLYRDEYTGHWKLRHDRIGDFTIDLLASVEYYAGSTSIDFYLDELGIRVNSFEELYEALSDVDKSSFEPEDDYPEDEE